MGPKEVLENMDAFARELVAHPEFNPQKMAKNGQYIRIGGMGFRAVSLEPKTPLSGYADKPSKNLANMFLQFNERAPKPMNVAPEKKEERCLQRYIIKSAMQHNRDMLKALSCKNTPYDELLFVTDEVSLDKVRCDILALGRIGADYYPVSIELKSNRDKKELIRQLDAFCSYIQKQEYGTLFSEIFITLTGQAGIKINTATPHKMIIWPRADSESKNGYISPQANLTRQDIVETKKIHLLEYYEFDNMSEKAKFSEYWVKV
jgi:hypothetical protein